MHTDPAYASNADSVQRYGETVLPDSLINCLRSTVTETPNLLAEIDQRIHARWMSFRWYKREQLYDRPKATVLHLNFRMVKSHIVEALLYGCRAWTPLKIHYNKLHTAYHRMLLRILGAWCKLTNNRILSYKNALPQTGCESIEATAPTRRPLWAGVLLRRGNHR